MERWLLLALMLAGAQDTRAQAVYRCVEKGKPVTFQNAPCDIKAKTTAVRGYVPDRTPTANELAWKRYNTEREMAVRNRRATAGGGAAAVMPAGGSACAAEQAALDAWERRVGLNRTVDGLRYWQDRVSRACR